VKFSTTWDPIPAGTGTCGTGQLGASLGAWRGTPEVHFNPAKVEQTSSFQEPKGGFKIIELSGDQTQYTSAVRAFNACWQHANDPANKRANIGCKGFNYSHVNDDPLMHAKATFTFMTGELTQIDDQDQATYMATWDAPLPGGAELVV